MDISKLVEKITWKGKKLRAPRSVEVSFVDTDKGYHKNVGIKEGDGLVFIWKENELFRGNVFSISRDKSAKSKMVAHDNLFYLVNNKDSYVFTEQSLDKIVSRICSDFQIPTGELTSSDYIIPYQVSDSKVLYDIILKAMDTTYNQTGKRYYLRAKEGKIDLLLRKENVRKWILEDGKNLINYNHNSSIENTITKVKMTTGEGDETIIKTAEDGSLVEQFGVLQYYKKVNDKINEGQLQERVDKALKEKGKVEKQISIEAIGIEDIISGCGVNLAIPELEIEKGYYVDEDTHTFKGNKHTMKLKLTETMELGVIV